MIKSVLAGGVATALVAFVTPASGKPTVAYYRFEHSYTGQTGLIDSSNYQRYGIVASGEPSYISDRPIHVVSRTGKVDKLSVMLERQDAAYFPYALPLQQYSTSTVEFWVKPLHSGAEEDIIWGSTSNSDGNQNRYVIGLSANSSQVFVNYIDFTGMLHNLGSSSQSLIMNQWSYVAIVRNNSEYKIYLNNASTRGKTELVSKMVDGTPSLPTASQFSLNGRALYEQSDCCQAQVELDELRFSNRALKPAEFLVSPSR